jgi:3-hydroxymyristoyl/3-hydroxydecanoyl-(acyl carrier protein) dehydratase
LLVIEALAQLSVLLAFASLEIKPDAANLTFFAGIDDACFGVQARAGDQVQLSSRLIRIRKLIGWFDATAQVDDRMVVRLRMIAAIRTGSSLE